MLTVQGKGQVVEFKPLKAAKTGAVFGHAAKIAFMGGAAEFRIPDSTVEAMKPTLSPGSVVDLEASVGISFNGSIEFTLQKVKKAA